LVFFFSFLSFYFFALFFLLPFDSSKYKLIQTTSPALKKNGAFVMLITIFNFTS